MYSFCTLFNATLRSTLRVKIIDWATECTSSRKQCQFLDRGGFWETCCCNQTSRNVRCVGASFERKRSWICAEKSKIWKFVNIENRLWVAIALQRTRRHWTTRTAHMRGPLARWIFETLGKGMGPIWVATSCRKKGENTEDGKYSWITYENSNGIWKNRKHMRQENVKIS